MYKGKQSDRRAAELKKKNLNRANLTRQNLGGANLVRANLRGANLSNANLIGSNLSEANLMEANLSGALLVDARLARAKLHGRRFCQSQRHRRQFPEHRPQRRQEPHHATDPHRQSGRIHQTPPRLQRQNAQHRLILTSVTLDPTLTTDACPELAGGLRITTFGFIGVHLWLALVGLPLAGHLLGFDHLRRVHVLGHVFYKIIQNLNFKTGKYAV